MPTEQNDTCSVLLVNEKAGNIFHLCLKVTAASCSRRRVPWFERFQKDGKIATQLVGIWQLRGKGVTLAERGRKLRSGAADGN